MTTFVVLGDHPAADKLVTAALNDYLDTHMEVSSDDDFAMVVAVRNPPKPAIKHVIEWCRKAGVYFEIVAASDKVPEFDDAADHRVSDNFLIDAIESGYSYSGSDATVLALVGEEDPAVDVTRALVRAADSHMVIRDLAEGALTYIKFHGDTVDEPPPSEEDEPMADEAEEVTLEELVEMADGGDQEAADALSDACAEFEIDPDEYATWAEVGELLEAAMAESEEGEPEPEEEEEEEETEGGWTAEALKNLTLKEVREQAQAAGIANWKTATRPELVKLLIAGTTDEPEEEAPAKPKKPTVKTEVGDLPAFDIDTLADAIIDRLIARLK
jgi:hypothetical protein